MPRPNPPPTPGSSSELGGREGGLAAPAFNLPPTAFKDLERASSSSTPSANGSDSSYRPVSPRSPEMSRKRPAPGSAGQVVTRDDFSLPPPPTRSRKIIQVKPKAGEGADAPASATPHSTTASSPSTATAPANASTGGGKRKQNNPGNTAAGRKIARKTAHSLIERRRRSKMNEEFGVLKDMIPACQGQEMHKLAILQASIDYLRYLEQCVADLQAQNNSPRPQPGSRSAAARHASSATAEETADGDDGDIDDDDEDMEDDRADSVDGSATPATIPLEPAGSMVSLPPLAQITSAATSSPSIFSSNPGDHHYSVSSASQPSYSPYFHSTQTSPAFGPQLHQLSATSMGFGSASGLGSPALKPAELAPRPVVDDGWVKQPQSFRGVPNSSSSSSNVPPHPHHRRSEHELDHEASAALLMLNHDRRSRAAQAGETGRSSTGLSVRDLLSG